MLHLSIVTQSSGTSHETICTLPVITNTVPVITNTVPVVTNTVPVVTNTVPVVTNTVPNVKRTVLSGWYIVHWKIYFLLTRN